MHTLAANYLKVADSQFERHGGILDQLNDEQLLWQVKEDIPPIIWHYAHTWHGESYVLRNLYDGDFSWAPPLWHEIFKIGSNLDEALQRLPGPAEIKEEVVAIRARLTAWLAERSEDEITSPLKRWDLAHPIFGEEAKSMAEFFAGLPAHSGHHQGEMMMLRRIQGGSRFV